jgi:DNA mismatch repair protein MutS2
MLTMEKHTLDVLEFETIVQIVSGYAAGALGREVAARMEPIRERDKLRASLDQTMELVRLLENGKRLPLAGVHDLKKHIRQAVELHRPFEPKEILDIESTLRASKSFYRLLSRLHDSFPSLKRLAKHFVSFDNITSLTEKMIDRRGKVADDASDRLKEVRKKITGLKFKLRGRIEEIIKTKKMRKHLRTAEITLRNGRFVLPVKTHNKGFVEGIIHGKSSSGETVFIEPEAIVLEGNELQYLLFEENREVTTILWRLTRSVLSRKDDILRVRDVFAWMDFTYAKARYAMDFRCAAPEIADGAGLELKDARHPILLSFARKELAEKSDDWAERVVPLTLRIGGDFTTLIITGPNTGGKTVALKTAGLCTVMALSGCPIPASPESSIPMFSHVLADIGDEQSIEQNLSTFSAHIARIISIMKNADEKSLVLIDELGAGTDPQEGAALSRAVLDELLSRRARVIATTHLGELKEYAYTREGVENASFEFDMETLSPTYRLFLGQPGNSNALKIAGRLGLDAGLLEAAEKNLAGGDRTAAELIQQMQKLRSQAENNLRTAEEKVSDLREKQEDLDRKTKQAEKKAEILAVEADTEIDEKLRSARKHIMDALRELKNAPKPHGDRAAELEQIISRELAQTPLESKRREFARSLKKGQDVFIITFSRKGRIKKINKAKERLTVQMGAMELETDFSDVSWLEGVKGAR